VTGRRSIARRSASWLVAAVAALAVTPAAAKTAVDAGALRARVSANPWHLTLVERGGRTLLAEDAGTGADAPGALGFRSGGAS
jgi:hypothetical protein